MRTIEGIDALRSYVGEDLGVSSWHEINQEEITAFAELTGDKYWIHVDPARAAIETPFGSTIAHGLLTLSLGPRLSDEIYTITAVPMCLNYGFGKVRFTAPVPVGSRVRMRAKLESIAEGAGGVTCTIIQTFERESADKPACVAQSLLRVVTG